MYDKEKARAYYMAHREERKIWKKEYTLKNKERIRQQDAEYRRTHKDRIKQANKKYNSRMAKTNKEKLEAYKSLHSCCLCKNNNPIVLQFHHVSLENKKGNVTDLVRSHSWSTVIKEIEKCVVVCANCHLIIHEDMRKCEASGTPFSLEKLKN